MNDFTRDELKELRTCLDAAYISGDVSPSMVNKNRYKIQAMIDNFCEHENDYRFNAVPEDGGLKMCKKCQRFYE